MATEKTGPNLSLEQLETAPITSPQLVVIEATQKNTGYKYELNFIFEHPTGPYISIRTEERQSFLQKGTEQQAQDALLELTKQAKEISGGLIEIHPFFGAVYQTNINPIASGFVFGDLDDQLITTICLTEVSANTFERDLTNKLKKIGAVVAIPGPNALSYVEYLKAPKMNPNQSNRDTAVINKLGEKWDEENNRFNLGPVSPVLTLSLHNIANFVNKLSQNAGLTDLTVTMLNAKDPVVEN